MAKLKDLMIECINCDKQNAVEQIDFDIDGNIELRAICECGMVTVDYFKFHGHYKAEEAPDGGTV